MRLAPPVALAAFSLILAPPAQADAEGQACASGICSVRLSAAQLLDKASQLVMARRFDEARPLVDALAQAPGMGLETHFLSGYIRVETGDLDGAIADFRAALVADPHATRVRLELARALMLKGQDGGADYNFRLAQHDGALPADIQATIRASRGILRDRRQWHMSTEFGIAPDSNITNGTTAETVDVTLGNQVLPLTLNGNARARSGLGQTARMSAGWRFGRGKLAWLADVDTTGVNYKGKSADDYTGQIALGPEIKLSQETQLSLQGIGSQRWYGGKRAATQFGGRLGLEHGLTEDSRVGLSLDARHTASGFSDDYAGWSMGAYATYERVVMDTMIASASLFGRTDQLNSAAYSNFEYGANLGLGGELPHGLNAGLSGGISRAAFDAALPALSLKPRADWRFNARVYAGLRSLRYLGFSPSVSYTFTKNASSLVLYKSTRSRFTFSLARYF